MSVVLLLLVLVLVLVTARPLASTQTAFQIQPGSSNDVALSPVDNEEPFVTPLVVLCVAAFLALALTLYIVKSLCHAAWQLLPRVTLRRPLPQPDAEQGDDKRCLDAVLDVDSDPDDLDEKYQDALDMTPMPLEEGSICPSPRPAWSVRAIDSPVLGLSTRQGDTIASESMPVPHRRAYRSAVPELDVALAMQLRPGLGLGADSAWMVRFLMTIFGWFAVVLTNGR